MRNLLSTLLVILISCLLSFSANDSLKYPEIGEPCPSFILKDVQHYTKSQVALEDFRGKWLILDFWGEYCAACIRAFPKVDSLQKDFSKDIQFLLIGVPMKGRDRNPKSIEKLYELHRKKLNLQIPIVFDDKLVNQFGANTFPHIVVIDPTGIVRYITSYLSRENIEDMIQGLPAKVEYKYNIVEDSPRRKYDLKTPFLIRGNGGVETGYLYRSVLAKLPNEAPTVMGFQEENKLEMIGYPLTNLYQYAFFGRMVDEFHSIIDSNLYGRVWPVAILEVANKSAFTPIWETKENLFAYSLQINKDLMEFTHNENLTLQNVLKKDLAMIFPYSAKIEVREMPFYEMRIKKSMRSRLKSTAESRKMEFPNGQYQGFVAKRIKLSSIISNLTYSTPDYDRKIPMILVGDDLEVDLTLESVYLEDVVKELDRKGIVINKSKKRMSVLVIYDL